VYFLAVCGPQILRKVLAKIVCDRLVFGVVWDSRMKIGGVESLDARLSRCKDGEQETDYGRDGMMKENPGSVGSVVMGIE
jgi:hypothetical protein